MGELLNLVTPLHTQTRRDYLRRMTDDKVQCMRKAREYGPDYWDGDRRYGYGGYRYIPGRWRPVAEALIRTYALRPGDAVLDVGCGKGFLLYEMQLLMPELRLVGFDVSAHALAHAHPDFRGTLVQRGAQDRQPYADKEFALVMAVGSLHNLRLFELETALTEIQRVGRSGYVMVESYRSELEQFNLQCWALTAHTFLDQAEWIWLYRHFGYTGDYEFIYFE
jgi:ubiquinone/menaquinone biosynthesis C-methylase UbiE